MLWRNNNIMITIITTHLHVASTMRIDIFELCEAHELYYEIAHLTWPCRTQSQLCNISEYLWGKDISDYSTFKRHSQGTLLSVLDPKKSMQHQHFRFLYHHNTIIWKEPCFFFVSFETKEVRRYKLRLFLRMAPKMLVIWMFLTV